MFEASDAFESGWFWRAGEFERLEAGQIIFVVNGDPESVVETEREYWREFEAERSYR